MFAKRLRTALVVALLGVATTAHADGDADRAQAREYGSKALEAADRGDWARAEDLFRRAEELYHAPTLLLGLARARVHLNKFVEAWEDYRRVSIEPLPPNASAAMKQAVVDGTKEMASVEGRRAHATITVAGASAPRVTLDGSLLPPAALGGDRLVNPGQHAVHAEAAGFKPSDTTFTVAEGGSATVTLDLAPESGPPPSPAPAATAATSPAAPSSAPAPEPGSNARPALATPSQPPASTSFWTPLRVAGAVTAGVGLAGVAVGGVFGGKTFSASSQQNTDCGTGATCANRAQALSDHSSAVTDGTVATVGVIAGSAVLAGGVILFLVGGNGVESAAPSASTGLRVVPTIGRSGGGLSLTTGF